MRQILVRTAVLIGTSVAMLALSAGCDERGAEVTPNDDARDASSADVGAVDVAEDTDGEDAGNDAGSDADNDARDVPERDLRPDPCEECSADERCVGGRCVDEPPCGCAFGEHCDVELNVCLPGCVDDINCGLGARCDDGGFCTPHCEFDEDCGVLDACIGGACQTRCERTDDCGFHQGCVEGACIEVDCRADIECPVGGRCVDFACVDVGAATCTEDGDCGNRWSCDADSRRCVRCRVQDDCPTHLTCAAGECVLPEQPPVGFEEQALGVVEEHTSGWNPIDRIGYGRGLAVLDYDGDGQLDVAAAQYMAGDPGVCVYRNAGASANARFERVEALCDARIGGYAVAGIDLDGDGRDELVVGGSRTLTIYRDGQEDEPVRLLGDADALRRSFCEAGAFAGVDADLDGLLDLYVGCQADFDSPETQETPELRANELFLQRPDGSWAPQAGDALEPLGDTGVTLAIGVLDIDDDGLLDLVLANDSYSTVGRRNTSLGPGMRYLRCEPALPCSWEASRLTTTDDSWGSFMGVGTFWAGDARYVYVPDWGPNRMLASTPGPAIDVAADFGLELADRAGFNLFAWSAIVDDFDFDGRDDVLVTHGSVPDPDVDAHAQHLNTLALQREDGVFSSFADELGLRVPSERTTEQEGVAAGSRAGLKTDLDGDGVLELFINNYLAPAEWYEQVPLAGAPQRCRIAPDATVVPAHGYGYSVWLDGDDRWRTRDVQGHIRSGASDHVLTSGPAGRFRFPSGAVVPFACDAEQPAITLTEPDWLAPIAGDARWGLAVDPQWLEAGEVQSMELAVRRADGSETIVAAGRDPELDAWVPAGLDDAVAVMARINNRWVQRWFERPE